MDIVYSFMLIPSPYYLGKSRSPRKKNTFNQIYFVPEIVEEGIEQH